MANEEKSTSLVSFEIYRKGEGKYVRFGTVIGLGLILIFFLFWLHDRVLALMDQRYNYLKAGILLILGLLGAWGIFLAVNRRKPADFMVNTEGEMRKVNWPSKASIIRSTQVVIITTLILAVMLFLVDYGFSKLFIWIGILPVPKQ